MVLDPRCWMPRDGPLSSWIENAQGRSSEPTAPSGLIDLHIGADLGRVRDHTAVAVTEVKLSRDYTQHYFVTYLHRFRVGLTWGHIVKKITTMRDSLKGSYGGTPVSLFWAVDATGVGSGVISMLQAAMKDESIFSVYMTAGQSSTINEYEAHVGKYQLVSTLVGALNSGTLHLPPDASDLVEELQNYEVRTSDAGRDSYNAKTGAHDDEVVALALSLWSCQNWGMRSEHLFW
jgi:hypothetical protein